MGMIIYQTLNSRGRGGCSSAGVCKGFQLSVTFHFLSCMGDYIVFFLPALFFACVGWEYFLYKKVYLVQYCWYNALLNLTKGRGKKKHPTFIVLLILKISLGPACKKENRSSSRYQDDSKTKDIHTSWDFSLSKYVLKLSANK